MITITLGQLMEAQPALERLAGERLPVKTAYRVARVLRLVRPEIGQFVEHRNDLVRELGVERRTATGEMITEVTEGNRPAFFAKVAELASCEVRLEIEPIEIAALDGVNVTAADCVALDWFIV
jgi:hypothetical protein